jgi:hypothetical protein
MGETGECKRCGKPTRFNSLVKGYSKYCSTECVNKSEEHVNKIKQSNLEKYGVENVFQLKDIQEKSKNKMIEKYGVEHNSYSEDTIKKRVETRINRSDEEKELSKQKLQDTWKNKSEMEVEATVNKRSITNLEKYGVENVFQSDTHKEKSKNTMFEKYGVVNGSYSEDIKEKRLITHRKNQYSKLLTSSKLANIVRPNFDVASYVGNDEIYSWICVKCNTTFSARINDGRIPLCPKCYKHGYRSKAEVELADELVKYGFDIIKNNKKVLDGVEIDIYIPDKRTGIEFNGLYWHSELGAGKDRNYHLNKYNLAESKDITLINIFEDEWVFKREIVLSIIMSKIGKCNSVFSRKCEVKEIDSNSAKSFLENNHIQGSIDGLNFGLIHGGQIVSLLTMGKSRFNQNYEYEILRYCNKLQNRCVGGLSRLFSHFVRKYNPSTVISYSDKRYGKGTSYLNCGFKYIGSSGPNYYYIKPNKFIRESRLKYQKHKLESILESYDPNLTEWQNMQLNGFDRIWDCGNNIYTWSK